MRERTNSMAKQSVPRKESVLPDSGNKEADEAWAKLLAEAHMELVSEGDVQALFVTVQRITRKDPNEAEWEYLKAVLRGQLLYR
jgi:hypothetical protein